MSKQEKLDMFGEPKRRYALPPKIKCACCGKTFQDTDLGAISRAILCHKPACSYECNAALGQVSK